MSRNLHRETMRAERRACVSQLVLVAIAGAALGCGAAARTVRPRPEHATSKAAPAPGSTAQAPAPTARATAAAIPDTPVGHQLSWVLGVLKRGGAALAEPTLRAHFAPAFLAKVPPAQLAAVLKQLAHAGPFKVRSLSAAHTTPHRLSAVIRGPKTTLRVLIRVSSKTGRIVGLLFQPGGAVANKPTSWSEVEKRLAALGGHAEYLAAAIKGGACVPLHQLDADREEAIGSAFKLYVLLALTDRISAGKAHWNDDIAIRKLWKSLPSGVTQNAPAGTKLSLQKLAERMISISDNTAADHLLYTVGRKRVEKALGEAGHAHPELDTPFLSTREMFLLKLAVKPAALTRYLREPAAARRHYLDRDLDARAVPPLSSAAGWTKPRHITDLEWFASPADLCRVMALLRARSNKPALAPLRHILSINPGVPDEGHAWSYIGFKGGSEPGVISLTWLLRRSDGRWFALSMMVNDPHHAVAENKFVAIAAGARDLLAKEGR